MQTSPHPSFEIISGFRLNLVSRRLVPLLCCGTVVSHSIPELASLVATLQQVPSGFFYVMCNISQKQVLFILFEILREGEGIGMYIF